MPGQQGSCDNGLHMHRQGAGSSAEHARAPAVHAAKQCRQPGSGCNDVYESVCSVIEPFSRCWREDIAVSCGKQLSRLRAGLQLLVP